eukprot:scaffold2541_cov175-Amphora_coffeaeformis.AAC.1
MRRSLRRNVRKDTYDNETISWVPYNPTKDYESPFPSSFGRRGLYFVWECQEQGGIANEKV